jgi:hypothetical protein
MYNRNQFCERFKRSKTFALKYFRSLPGGYRLGFNSDYRMTCFVCDRERTGTVYDHNGVWFYNCYGCGHCGDVIRIISIREEIRGKELISFLKDLAVEWDDFDFKSPTLNRIEKYSVNRKLVQDLFNEKNLKWYIGSIYAGKVRWIKDYLLKLLDLAEDKTKNEDEIFTSALCEFGGRRDAMKLYLTRLGGLMEIADIPAALLFNQESYKFKNGNKNLISAHYMPVWTSEMIINAINIISEASEFGITTDNCTKRQIEAQYGHEAVNRVFHGETTRKPAKTTPETLTEETKIADQFINEINSTPTKDPIPEFEKLKPKLEKVLFETRKSELEIKNIFKQGYIFDYECFNEGKYFCFIIPNKSRWVGEQTSFVKEEANKKKEKINRKAREKKAMRESDRVNALVVSNSLF